ncbi:MAG: hypothetical protein NC078_03910 [Ruminococcus sp.]|nr:hypothetical protein [Ruminococcus sp.]
MLDITVPGRELFDEERNEFYKTRDVTLRLEHSLVSLSKWESMYRRSFINYRPETYDEIADYVKCMTINQNVDPMVYRCLSDKNIWEINEYIDSPMTATTFSDNSRGDNRVVTSEQIYGWMIDLGIPFECSKWHLNRLMTLIRVCAAGKSSPKKMSQREIMRQNAELNAKRRAMMNSKG